MSCWRVLQVHHEASQQIPPLLVKSKFDKEAYTVYLTDLSNIWSESLSLGGIIHRADQHKSPIEVTKQNTTQLAILLENVRNSLAHSGDAACCITQSGHNNVILHTTIGLPKPLDCLRWNFHLEKRTSAVLKQEFILPLLVATHLQQERINSLIATTTDKDKAIDRLVDQYESSNLDLATAFPSIGGLEPSKRPMNREQAALHIPALQPFKESSWEQRTAQLGAKNSTTLELFQEALSQCTPDVPEKLQEEGGDDAWWTSIHSSWEDVEIPIFAPRLNKSVSLPKPTVSSNELSEEETEDEFETNEHFKSPEIANMPIHGPVPTSSPIPESKAKHEGSQEVTEGEEEEDDDGDDDDDDLDAPPKSQSQSHSASEPLHGNSTTIKSFNMPKTPFTPAHQSKGKGFRIGGKANKQPTLSPPPNNRETVSASDVETKNQPEASVSTGNEIKTHVEGGAAREKVRRPFKIGGKQKIHTGDENVNRASKLASEQKDNNAILPETSERTSATILQTKESTQVGEEKEETAEEKAERKRRELKRKNAELAKKQAQTKKKKRF